jgi:hypothetical protein
MSILSKILEAIQRGASELESAAIKFDTYVERQKQIQSATIDMISGYQLERRYIDVAWESAERELEIERKYASDPQGRKRFEEIRAELEAKLEAMPNMPKSQNSAEYACVDLRPPARHPNPEVATAIEQKYTETAAECAAALNDVLRRLERQRGMRPLFEEKLIGIGGAQILARIKALEAGREWRHVPSAVLN